MSCLEPLMQEPSKEKVELSIGKLKSYKAGGTDNIPSELIKACGEAEVSKIHLLIKMIWDNEKMSEEWKESILIHKKSSKTDCNNYRVISLLPVCYKILILILTSRITEYPEEIIGDYQCGFRRNRSTVDHIFSLSQLLKYNGIVHQLFIDFKKVYNSIDRQKVYYILIEQGIPKRLVNIVRMYMMETFNKIRIGNHYYKTFEVRSDLKQGDSQGIREVTRIEKGLNPGGKIPVLGYADD